MALSNNLNWYIFRETDSQNLFSRKTNLIDRGTGAYWSAEQIWEIIPEEYLNDFPTVSIDGMGNMINWVIDDRTVGKICPINERWETLPLQWID